MKVEMPTSNRPVVTFESREELRGAVELLFVALRNQADAADLFRALTRLEQGEGDFFSMNGITVETDFEVVE